LEAVITTVGTLGWSDHINCMGFSDRWSDCINFELQIRSDCYHWSGHINFQHIMGQIADVTVSIFEVVPIANLVLSIFCPFRVRSPIWPYHILEEKCPISQYWRILKRIPGSRFRNGSLPKFNRFFLVHRYICGKIFMKMCSVVFQ